MIEKDPSLGEPLVAGLPYLKAEAVYAATYEMARTVDDVLARRTRARILARDAADDAAPEVARLIAPVLGLSEKEQVGQVADYRTRSAGGALAPRRARMKPEPGAPTAPIEIAGGPATARDHLAAPRVDIPEDVLAQLRSSGADVTTDPDALGRVRPGLVAARHGVGHRRPGRRPAVRGRPSHLDRAGLGPARDVRPGPHPGHRPRAGAAAWWAAPYPCTAAWCSTSARMSGIVSVDPVSLVVEVLAGTFGDRFEAELTASHQLTVGHWPQSMALSTVGGWIACRGAGQLSNRYGKIEDIVVGPRGRPRRRPRDPHRRAAPPGRRAPISTSSSSGPRARSASITRAWLQAHPAPTHTRHAAYGFAVVRRGPRRHAPDHPTRRVAGRHAPLRRGRVEAQPRDRGRRQRAARPRRGRRHDGRRRHGGGGRGVRVRPAARRRPRRPLDRSSATTWPRSRR